MDSETTGYVLKSADALPHDINEWEDYFRVEVGRPPDDIEKIREMKEQSVEELIALFSTWRSGSASFEDDHAAELVDARKYYVRVYLEKRKRLAQGDFMATIDSPVDTLIVESMLCHDNESMSFIDRFRRITEFFFSPYFSEVPYEAIFSGLFVVLRKRVRQGHYQNPEKAKDRLSGFFYDIEFIATYAPYCDAVILDNVMMDFVNDPDLRLSQRYGTRFFSRNNWAEFLEYLRVIESKKTVELEWALRAVHP